MDYKELEYLRKNSHLSIFEKSKVKKLRREAIERQYIINKINRCMLGADFSEAEKLEYDLRMRKFALDLYPLWNKYGDGLGLYDFACKVVRDNKDKEQPKKLIRR